MSDFYDVGWMTVCDCGYTVQNCQCPSDPAPEVAEERDEFDIPERFAYLIEQARIDERERIARAVEKMGRPRHHAYVPEWAATVSRAVAIIRSGASDE